MSSISGYGSTAAADMLAQMRARMFAKTDANGDGSIDKSEFEAGPQRSGSAGGTDGTSKKDELFAKIDADGDGKLTKDEFKAFDQKISSEMQSLMLSLQGAGGPPPSNDDDADGSASAVSGASSSDQTSTVKGKHRHHHHQQAQSVDDLFAKMDSNGDGSVTKDELSSFQSSLLSAQENSGSANGTGGASPFQFAQYYGSRSDSQNGASWQNGGQGQLAEMLMQLGAV